MSFDLQTKKLHEVIELIIDNRGRNPKSYSTDGIPIIDNYLITSNGEVNLDEVKRFIDEETYNSFLRKYIKPDDVLMTLVGNGYGKVATTPQEKCAIIQNTIGLRCNEENCSQFLYYLLRNNKELLMNLNRGAAQPSIKVGDILDLQLEFPSLDNQECVAYILGALDKKIKLNTQTNQTLETIAQAIFKSWFVDFDPVKAKIAALNTLSPWERDGVRAKELAELAAMSVIASKSLDELAELKQNKPDSYKKLTQTAALFPSKMQESELGKIPEGWDIECLGEIIEFNLTRKLAKGTLAPYLDMKNLPTKGHLAGEVILREMASGTKFINGDTLLARITPCLENGKTAFVDFLENAQVGWGSTEYIVMRPKNDRPTSLGYMIARLDSFRAKAIQTMTGTSGRQRASATALAEQKWISYPLGLLEKFDLIAGGYLSLAGANGKQNKLLAEIRNTLLPKLLSGDIDLSDVKKEISEAAA